MVASEPNYDSVRLRMPCHQSCMVVSTLSLIGLHALQFPPSQLNRDVLCALSGVRWRSGSGLLIRRDGSIASNPSPGADTAGLIVGSASYFAPY